MTGVGLGRIQPEPSLDVPLRVRQALGRLSNPDLLRKHAITIDDDGRLTLLLVAGSGLTQDEDGLTLTNNRVVTSVSVSTAAGSTARTRYIYLVSGASTITLPTAVSNTSLYTVKNIGVATVTIATTSAQTIDGSALVTLPVTYTSLDMVSDGANWSII